MKDETNIGYPEENPHKDLEETAIRSNDFFGTSWGGQFGSDRGFESYSANCD